MVGTGRNITAQDAYEALLLGYAAGLLDQAQSFVIAMHLALSPPARKRVSLCEALGGVLMEKECSPAAMREGSLESVLARLDRPAPWGASPARQREIELPADLGLPEHIAREMRCSCTSHKKWKALYPGLKAYELHLECRRSKARLMRAEPHFKSPRHTHGGIEITLVLDGAYSDETGSYARGDLAIADESMEHTMMACRERGCVSLVVSSAPMRLTGLAALLNPFIRF